MATSLGLGLSLGGLPSTIAAFTPTDMTNLKLWLDADDSSTITESGGSVSLWEDKSGDSRNASRSVSARQPKTGVRTIGGKNVITFDGTDDNMELLNPLSNVTAWTSFIILNTSASNASSAILGYSGGSTNHGTLKTEQWNNTGKLGYTRRNVADYASSINTPSGDAMFTTYTTSSSNLVFSSGGSSDTVNVGATRMDLELLGATTPAGSDPYVGDIGEVLFYERQLTAEEISTVESYLAAKWGL